ncbi:EboA domain-containing protein [Hymenobacter sp. YC55]|uniref:EboA domain-containing protein n=1 Tax=Hymenobacter sp. YC55 TaxID=3034019 RepID=UPI0023F84991|nr:EboA domain-containing protein [Hymenobacter sp. YC55]MDF7815895.1 EboA domain-containing protein [Hymenobacter sp. YC55]
MPVEAYQPFLLELLLPQLSEGGQAWIRKQLTAEPSDQVFYLAFTGAPRFVGKLPLRVTTKQVAEANRLRTGFNPQNWTADQLARTALLLQALPASPHDLTARLDRLFSTADLGELVALYAALPLLPHPQIHVKRAAEGVRTTMTAVFDAIALRNPYPHDYLSEEAWNQLVLKAVFNARPLHQIYGLEERRNAPLARILFDYAHERWAAGRTLTPEVWRLVGPYLTDDHRADMQRLLRSDNLLEAQAAALALTESNTSWATELLNQHPVARQINEPEVVSWQSIGESAYAS